jgi:ribonuclease BN (tRNA processing enzyme)
MKYVIKAITTNNRDLKTAIYLLFDERAYLFNVPDGFQRMALNQKMKFGKVRYVFLSSLHPDYYGGFPGFYLSAREAQSADLSNMRVSVFGPKLIRKLIQQGYSFYSNVNQLEIFDYGLMAGNNREYKSVDGTSFRFEEVDKLLKSK